LAGEEVPGGVREAVDFSFGAGVPPFGPKEQPGGRIHPLSGGEQPLALPENFLKILTFFS